MQMLKRIKFLQTEKDQKLALVMDLEGEVAKLKEEKLKLIEENAKLSDDIAQLKIKVDSIR